MHWHRELLVVVVLWNRVECRSCRWLFWRTVSTQMIGGSRSIVDAAQQTLIPQIYRRRRNCRAGGLSARARCPRTRHWTRRCWQNNNGQTRREHNRRPTIRPSVTVLWRNDQYATKWEKTGTCSEWRQPGAHFLQRAAMLALQALYTSYGISVRLSVHLSHAGIVSQRRHVARCNLPVG